jgi:hypothetical protein
MCIFCENTVDDIAALGDIIIIVHGCSQLTHIPYISGTTTINIYHCPNLVSISGDLTIRKLTLYNCTAINAIPIIETLEYLDCELCDKIVIPAMPNLNTIILRQCLCMQIPFIVALNQLKLTDCQSISIPSLPNLNHLLFNKLVRV